MTSLSRAGIAGILAAVAAAVILLAVAAGAPDEGGGAPGGSDGQARAERLFAALTGRESFRAAGGSVSWESAEALGATGVLIRKPRIAGRDRRGRPTELAADEVRVRRLDRNTLAPRHGDIEIRGLTAANDRIAAFVAASGAAAFVADVTARWDAGADSGGAASGSAAIHAFELAIRDWGTLTLRAQFDGVDFAALQDMQKEGEIDPALAMGLMAGARIGAFEVAFTDRGAIDLLAAKRAADTGLTQQQVVARLLTGLEARKAGLAAAGSPAILGQALDALIAAIGNRGTIALSAAPEKPVPLLRLALALRSDRAAVDRLVRDLGLAVAAR